MLSLDKIQDILKQRAEVIPSDEPGTRAAVAIILREPVQGWGSEVLFIQRSEDPRDPWSGHMAFPGGRKDESDVDLRHTTEREVLEEIGLDLRKTSTFLRRMEDLPAYARGRRVGMVVTPFVYALTEELREDALQLSDEVAALHWSPLLHLSSEKAQGTLDYVHEGTLLKLPCVRLENNKTVWGLTYQMLSTFLQTLRTP